MSSFFAKEKKIRFKKIEEILKRAGESDFEKTVGMLQLHFGVTEKKAKEYLKAFAQAGLIEVKDNVIKWIGDGDEGQD